VASDDTTQGHSCQEELPRHRPIGHFYAH
jgi:hypothetical protein